jgi:hypothetical protein
MRETVTVEESGYYLRFGGGANAVTKPPANDQPPSASVRRDDSAHCAIVTELSTHIATRYVQPLREGGSLPAIVETERDGMFVVKFRGAGQGAKVLIAELIVGLLAKTLGLPVPDLAIVDIPPPFGRSEPDPEIQEILRRSHGVNVGIRYLDGAFNLDVRAAGDLLTPELAAQVVWLDAFVTNPDRTHRNPNVLVWQRRPWLIDHGAALYVHHDWAALDEKRVHTSFPLIRDHVLLARSGDLEAADHHLSHALSEDVFARILARVPDALLVDTVGGREFASAADARHRYLAYLSARLRGPRAFVAEALAAKERALREPPRPLSARR